MIDIIVAFARFIVKRLVIHTIQKSGDKPMINEQITPPSTPAYAIIHPVDFARCRDNPLRFRRPDRRLGCHLQERQDGLFLRKRPSTSGFRSIPPVHPEDLS
jgi:hypothetical protein